MSALGFIFQIINLINSDAETCTPEKMFVFNKESAMVRAFIFLMVVKKKG
jgi:hypothetical protein